MVRIYEAPMLDIGLGHDIALWFEYKYCSVLLLESLHVHWVLWLYIGIVTIGIIVINLAVFNISLFFWVSK
jgi:hypothetical protein